MTAVRLAKKLPAFYETTVLTQQSYTGLYSQYFKLTERIFVAGHVMWHRNEYAVNKLFSSAELHTEQTIALCMHTSRLRHLN
jgi:hypothetical protein